MRILLTKLTGDRHALEIERAGGQRERVELETRSCLLHDSSEPATAVCQGRNPCHENGKRVESICIAIASGVLLLAGCTVPKAGAAVGAGSAEAQRESLGEAAHSRSVILYSLEIPLPERTEDLREAERFARTTLADLEASMGTLRGSKPTSSRVGPMSAGLSYRSVTVYLQVEDEVALWGFLQRNDFPAGTSFVKQTTVTESWSVR